MAKGIYVGVGVQTVPGDIVPKTWTQVTIGTEYVAANGTKLTASSYRNANYASCACDGEEDDQWRSLGANDPNPWIKLEFPEAVKITKMKTDFCGNTGYVKEVKIQGSNNDSDWIDLYSSAYNTTVSEVTLNNPDYYKFYRKTFEFTSASNALAYTKDWQVEEYVPKPNIAHKAKKVYIGVGEDSLVANGDFSNGLSGWTVSATNYFTTKETTKGGENCVEITLTTPTTAGTNHAEKVISHSVNALNMNHIYYFGYRYYGDSGNNNFRPIVGQTNGTGTQYFATATDCSAPEWQSVSERKECTVAGNSIHLALFTQNANSELTAGMKMYFTNFKVYDLTAMFGAGNEPTKEWCDTNLEELKTLYKSQNGIARKVKKGYIGVNGIAQQFYPKLVPTTTAQLFFKLVSFADGLKPVSGYATETLKDGTRPTLEVSTGSSGFYRSTSKVTDYDNIYAVVSGSNSTTASNLNTVLSQTKSTYSSNTRIQIGSNSATIRLFTFDFKTPRTLKLLTRAGSTSVTVSGKNDGGTWSILASAAAAKACEAVSNTAYRYYRVQLDSSTSAALYYLYFENIQDWVEE